MDHQLRASPDRLFRVALYAAVPAAQERFMETAHFSLGARAVQLLDIASAFVSKRPSLHFSAWDVPDSNKGDILIRIQVEREIERALGAGKVTFFEIGWNELDEQKIHEINETCDLFVIAGSGYLFPVRDKLPKRLIRDCRLIPQIRCPKAAMAIGYNTIAGEEEELSAESVAMLKALLDSLDLISVRDRRTVELVRNVSGKTPVLAGDPVLLFKEAVSPAPSRDASHLRLGVNLAMHGPISVKRVEREIDVWADLLKRLQALHRIEWHYVAHVPSERAVYWLLRGRGIHLHWHDPLPVDLPAVYASLDAHICQMMHSAITAVSVNLPVTAFAYDRKIDGLFELLGLSAYCVPVHGWTPQSVLPVIERMIANRPSIREKIMQAKDALLPVSEGFTSEVADLIRLGSGLRADQ
ncbi:MAG TPA: polysaccharide pyruvyl transferase family protein [Rhizomicrobium sp.]|nr:polysaccharide pyruvyl transferase family protein [Rhizomicrobium sp.]